VITVTNVDYYITIINIVITFNDYIDTFHITANVLSNEILIIIIELLIIQLMGILYLMLMLMRVILKT